MPWQIQTDLGEASSDFERNGGNLSFGESQHGNIIMSYSCRVGKREKWCGREKKREVKTAGEEIWKHDRPQNWTHKNNRLLRPRAGSPSLCLSPKIKLKVLCLRLSPLAQMFDLLETIHLKSIRQWAALAPTSACSSHAPATFPIHTCVWHGNGP